MPSPSILAALALLFGTGWQVSENQYREKTVTGTYLDTPVSLTLQQTGPATEVIEARPSARYPHAAAVEYNAGQAGTSRLVTEYRRALLDHCSGNILGTIPTGMKARTSRRRNGPMKTAGSP